MVMESGSSSSAGDITEPRKFHGQQASSDPAASPYLHHSTPTESSQSYPSPLLHTECGKREVNDVKTSFCSSPTPGSDMSSSPDLTMNNHPSLPRDFRHEENGDLEMGSQKPQNYRGRVPFRKFELGKMTMAVVAPTTTLLVGLEVWTYSSPLAAIPLLFLCYGSLFIIVGVVMSHDFPSAAKWIEEAGVVLVFGSFTWSMGSMFYPRLYLMAMPILGFLILFIALLVLRYIDPHGQADYPCGKSG